MNKKGAVNLSINMIIVLIIAIIVLGFALNFITGMFRKTEVAIEGQFPTIEVPVSRDDPIGIGDEFLIRDGEVRKISLKVFNPTANAVDTADLVDFADAISCKKEGGEVTPPSISDMEEKLIAPGSTATIRTVITGGSGMIDNAICKISLQPTDTAKDPIEKSFFLNTK